MLVERKSADHQPCLPQLARRTGQICLKDPLSPDAFREFQYPTPPLGTSESGFRAEVESEQALARGEHLLAVIDAHEHTHLAGPAAAEAAHRLEDFGQRARFQGTVVLDDRRLRRIMSRHDPAVYPGTYITCVHDPARALCERARQGAFEGLGDHPQCQPLACRNVALTHENTAVWRQEIEHLEGRLAESPPLPPLVQHRLLQRRDQIADFLTTAQEPS